VVKSLSDFVNDWSEGVGMPDAESKTLSNIRLLLNQLKFIPAPELGLQSVSRQDSKTHSDDSS
jgi:hypothetical protein